jgi:hypothetical protein
MLSLSMIGYGPHDGDEQGIGGDGDGDHGHTNAKGSLNGDKLEQKQATRQRYMIDGKIG